MGVELGKIKDMQNLVRILTRDKENEELTRDEIEALDKFITEITPTDSFLKPLTFGHVVKATDGKYNRKKFKKGFYYLSDNIEKCEGKGWVITIAPLTHPYELDYYHGHILFIPQR